MIAVIRCADDPEEKWVVAPEGAAFTAEQIAAELDFQGKYFRSTVILEAVRPIGRSVLEIL